MKKKVSKTLALLLSAMMLASTLPQSAMAEDFGSGMQTEQETVIEATNQSQEEISLFDDQEQFSAPEDESVSETDEETTDEEASDIFTSGEEVVSEEELNTSAAEDFTYTINDDGTATITGYKGSDTDITIPSEINGHSVTAIGDSAFKSNNLISVSIPASITSIGDSFTITDQLVFLCEAGSYAETYAINNNIHYEESVTASEDATYKYVVNHDPTQSDSTLTITGYMGSETDLTIPSKIDVLYVTAIGDSAFRSSNLTSVIIPGGVTFFHTSGTAIRNYAFYGCSKLTAVILQDGVGYIGYQSFGNCTALKQITIPNSVTSIDDYAFESCDNLTIICNSGSYAEDYAKSHNIHYADPNSDADYEYVMNEDGTVTITGYKGSETDLSIPSVIYGHRVTAIGFAAFFEKSFTSVNIPDSITSIGESAFADCKYLKSIILPNSITSIGDYAFSLCSSLNNITLPYPLTSIGNFVFGGCSSLTNITLTDHLTSIGNHAFDGCSSLNYIYLPRGITSIGSYAFSECKSLINIHLPDTITTISNGLFYKCSSLRVALLPSGITSIGHSAFEGCTYLPWIEIPSGVTSIGSNAFQGCTGLVTIFLPDSLKSIDSYAFYDCPNFDEITIPSSVSYIGDNAIGMSYYGEEKTYKPIKTFRIFGYEGSEAERYAKKNGINFKSLSGSDTSIITPTVTAPTASTLTYTGKAQPLVKAGSTTGGTMYYSLNNKTWSKKIPKAKEIGTYKVYYKVKGNSEYESVAAKYVTVKIVPQAVAITSVTRKGSKTLTVNWTKNEQATGYQIEVLTGQESDRYTVRKNVTSKKITKSSKGTTCYIRVRAYKTVGNKNYFSAWSEKVAYGGKK